MGNFPNKRKSNFTKNVIQTLTKKNYSPVNYLASVTNPSSKVNTHTNNKNCTSKTHCTYLSWGWETWGGGQRCRRWPRRASCGKSRDLSLSVCPSTWALKAIPTPSPAERWKKVLMMGIIRGSEDGSSPMWWGLWWLKMKSIEWWRQLWGVMKNIMGLNKNTVCHTYKKMNNRQTG